MNALLSLVAATALAAGAAGDTVVVKRDGARLMKAPRSYGASCGAKVASGTAVKVLERQKGWARIASPGGGGCWLHESAWSDRTAGALAGGGGAGSQRDVELAARGFSEGEESRFRGEHRDLATGYQLVEDYLAHADETAPEELQRFVNEGRLVGGAR